MIWLIFVCYAAAILGLFIYGVNCYVLIAGFAKNQSQKRAQLQQQRKTFWEDPQRDLPVITIQLPVFNERYVVGRLIHAVTQLDYPKDKMEIQILDDSTDDTVDLVATLVHAYELQGFHMAHLKRSHREGYKAGALKAGMAQSRGALIAIFDADFVPKPDFLKNTLPFFEDEKTGLVQCRWGHVNEAFNPLTRIQALAIDGHFGIEQAGRCWQNHLLNFNGTAGIWRRDAITQAGGWQADTLTEDLDLSYRAQLSGWRIQYVLDEEVPAEVPTEMSAFKSQQRRWAKGSIQTALKMLPLVLADRKLPRFTRLQSAIHLTHYMVHPLMLTMALLSVPLLQYWDRPWPTWLFAGLVVLLVLSTCGPSALYVASQRALKRNCFKTLLWLPGLMVVGTGIAVSNTKAVLEALLGVPSAFIRTPKGNTGTTLGGSRAGYRLPFDALFLLEWFMAGWCGYGLWLYVDKGKWLIGPFLALYAVGFFTVGTATLWERVKSRWGTRPPLPVLSEHPVTVSEMNYREIMAKEPKPVPVAQQKGLS